MNKHVSLAMTERKPMVIKKITRTPEKGEKFTVRKPLSVAQLAASGVKSFETMFIKIEDEPAPPATPAKPPEAAAPDQTRTA